MNNKIIIATHYLVYGAPHALREYLINNKINKLLFIAHPLQIDDTKSYIEKISDGNIDDKKTFSFRSRISFINYFIEIFLTLKWVLKEKGNLDLFVGVDCLNCFAGIILRKLGKVKKVVFYTIDYVPNRFSNKFLNNIYHWIDKFCVKYADETWNLSYRMAEGREKIRGLKQSVYNKQKIVPIGIWFDRVKRLPFDQIKKHQLFFVGNLSAKQGIYLAIEAIPEIIKTIPDFHFLIVGGGDYQKTLIEKVKQLNIDQYVTFTGWVKDRSQLDKVMADSALSIAIYGEDSLAYYADPTKLKDYLSAGLPILLTNLPYNAYEIQDKKCGIIIKEDKEQIAQAIIGLLKDESKLQQYRENALNYAKQFDWSNIFENNLKRILCL